MHARFQMIRPTFAASHGVCRDKVEEMLRALLERHGVSSHYGLDDSAWDFPAVLVVDDTDGEYIVLDGHHRLAVARRIEETAIPAWVVDRDEYEAWIAEHGEPARLGDLDDEIDCDGRTYTERGSRAGRE